MTRGWLRACLVSLLMLSVAGSARAADAVRSCGGPEAAGGRCLVRRGAPQIEDQAVRFPTMSLELSSGTVLTPERLSAEARSLSGAPSLDMVVEASREPLAIELVVVVQQPPLPLTNRRLNLLKAQLTRIAEAVAAPQLNGSLLRLISYSSTVERLSEAAASGSSAAATSRSAKEAIAALAMQSQTPGGQVLHEAVVVGLESLTKSSVPTRPKILVIISDGDSGGLDEDVAAPFWSFLGSAARRQDIAVDIIHLSGAAASDTHRGYDPLALQTGGVIRLADEASLANQVTHLIHELQGHYMVRVSTKAQAGAQLSGLYSVKLHGDGTSVLNTDAKFVFPPAQLPSASVPAVAPVRAPVQASERHNSGGGTILAGLVLVLVVLVGMAVRSTLKVVGKPAPRAVSKHQRLQLVAWLVPITGPSAFKTLEIPPAGLTVGNSSRFDLYVGIAASPAVSYHVAPALDQDGCCLTCPPGASAIVNGSPHIGNIVLSDNAEIVIGDTKIIYKCCDLDT